MKSVLFFILSLLMCCCKSCDSCGRADRPTGLIIGGTQVNRGKWPWLVALFKANDSKFLCGGTLISNKHIVSGNSVSSVSNQTFFRSTHLKIILFLSGSLYSWEIPGRTKRKERYRRISRSIWAIKAFRERLASCIPGENSCSWGLEPRDFQIRRRHRTNIPRKRNNFQCLYFANLSLGFNSNYNRIQWNCCKKTFECVKILFYKILISRPVGWVW